jgi:hypothetical protein
MKKQNRSKLKPCVKCPKCERITRRPPFGTICPLCVGEPTLVPCWSNGEKRLEN